MFVFLLAKCIININEQTSQGKKENSQIIKEVSQSTIVKKIKENFEQSKDNRYEKEVNTHTGRKALKRSSSDQKKKQGAPPESEKKGLFTQKSIRIFLEKKEIPELDPIGKRKRKLSKENSPDRESAPTKKNTN